MDVPMHLRHTAGIMRHNLENNRLRVTLRWINGGSVALRVADSQNPDWYMKFCAAYAPSARSKPRQRKKPDTFIKRAHVLRALDELASGKCETVYAQRLLPVVADIDQRCWAGTYNLGG